MTKNITTPASVAARLTDDEIERLAEQYEITASQSVATDSIRKHYTNSAAVLRDYVRMRKFVNAVEDALRNLVDEEGIVCDCEIVYKALNVITMICGEGGIDEQH